MNQDHFAVFGSAFNPPHLGHADVIEQIFEHTERVVLVPSYQHAFGKQMMPFDWRLQMLKAMLSDLNITHRVKVLDIERDIAEQRRAEEGGKRPVYTFDVLEALEAKLATKHLVFVVGPDNAEPDTWQKFYKSDELLRRWQMWAAEERLVVRSSEIRRKLAAGERISEKECSAGVIRLLQSREVEK